MIQKKRIGAQKSNLCKLGICVGPTIVRLYGRPRDMHVPTHIYVHVNLTHKHFQIDKHKQTLIPRHDISYIVYTLNSFESHSKHVLKVKSWISNGNRVLKLPLLQHRSDWTQWCVISNILHTEWCVISVLLHIDNQVSSSRCKYLLLVLDSILWEKSQLIISIIPNSVTCKMYGSRQLLSVSQPIVSHNREGNNVRNIKY